MTEEKKAVIEKIIAHCKEFPENTFVEILTVDGQRATGRIKLEEEGKKGFGPTVDTGWFILLMSPEHEVPIHTNISRIRELKISQSPISTPAAK